MIQNESRYKEKILTSKEKAAIESGINVSIYFFCCGFIFLLLSLLSILFIFIYIFINPVYAATSFMITVIFMVLSTFFLFFSERDAISSKGLNERLFIYFDFLEHYIKRNKNKLQIWMISKRLVKYLHELEKNLKNIFLFNSSEIDIQLVLSLRKLLIEDIAFLVKSGGKQLVLELIDNIKQAHLSSESMNLFDSKKAENTIEHAAKISSVIASLEACQKIERNDSEKQSALSKIYKLILTPSLLISLCIIVSSGLMYYINRTENFSRMPANLSVIAFMLSIIFFIMQSRKP